MSGMGQIKESLLTRGFNLQCKVFISRENLLDIAILKQIGKLCFLVLFPIMWYCATETATVFMLIIPVFL